MKQKKWTAQRGWVKNALIIFLIVLLLLTFFSNTILNYSLPEVAAQYPQSTTITTKVRGSGTVEAARTYDVVVEETRTVASVNVKVGDTVKAGDTLLTLDEMESTELTAARENLAALQLEYDKMQVEAADQSSVTQTQLQQLEEAVTNAEAVLSDAQTYQSNLASYRSAVTSAQNTLTSRTQALSQAQAEVERLQGLANEENVINSNAEYLAARQRMEDAADEETRAEAQENVQKIYEEQIAPTLSSLTQQLNAAQQALANASADVGNAQAALESAQAALSDYEASHTDAVSVSAAEESLQYARDALASAQAQAADDQALEAYDSEIANLELEAKAQEVADAKEKVSALEAKTSAAKIVSRYDGIVQTVNVAAGDVTSAEMPLMVVELTEQGYTLTAAVTKEQAAVLSEGLTAEVTNLWNSGITMTLDAITTDASDPSNSRILNFTVQGDNVAVGQNLSFSIGAKNANYDIVIPSSAIHVDSDGSFVYAVSVKSSPLGNRYTVKKISVNVLASDDTNSAVSGGLSTADFVITTSTMPLEVGDRVRIAE